MVSDGRQYKVWVPFTNKMYIGRRIVGPDRKAGHAAAARPRILPTRCSVDIEPLHQQSQITSYFPNKTTVWTHSYYVVTIVDVEARVRWSSSRGNLGRSTNMEIVRHVVYGRRGLELTDTTFSGYQVSGDAPFPRVVTIYRPIET